MVVVHFEEARSSAALFSLLLWCARLRKAEILGAERIAELKHAVLALSAPPERGRAAAPQHEESGVAGSVAVILRTAVGLEVEGEIMRHERMGMKRTVCGRRT